MNTPKNKYLGKLCCRRHDYEGTGMSLRAISGAGCVVCKPIDNKIWRKNNPEKRRVLESRKSKRRVELLTDYYVKGRIVRALRPNIPIRKKDIPAEAIIAKRELLKLKREIWELR